MTQLDTDLPERIADFNLPPFQGDAKLHADSLHCSRGFNELIRDLTLTLGQGEALHIQGRNGVGKTTLLRTLATLTHADSGDIFWQDGNVRDDLDAYRANLGYLGHKPGLFPSLSIEENLRYFTRLNCVQNEQILSQLMTALDVADCADLPCFQLSAGQKQRASLARVAASGTRLWILDEPANSLDNHGRQLLESILISQLEAGGMVVFTSHLKLNLGPALQTLNLG